MSLFNFSPDSKTFDECVETDAVLRKDMAERHWVTKRHSFLIPSFIIAHMKRRHFLVAPEEVGRQKMEEWLSTTKAEWGSAGEAKLIDVSGQGSFTGSGDCAEVYERLERYYCNNDDMNSNNRCTRYEEAIIAAQADINNYPCNPLLLTQSHMAIGRSAAKLSRPAVATKAFEAAITEARKSEIPLWEMLAIRDLIVHVLDAQGQRDSQLPALGRAISRMVLPPREYNAVLGEGFDADAAVHAFKAHRE